MMLLWRKKSRKTGKNGLLKISTEGGNLKRANRAFFITLKSHALTKTGAPSIGKCYGYCLGLKA